MSAADDSARVLVTGASGFLGRAVVRSLEQRGVAVTGLSRQRVPGLTQVSDYGMPPQGAYLIHLAESPDLARARETSAGSIATIARIVERFGSRVVYASSSTVYQDTSATPLRENAAVAPSNDYTRMKLTNEAAVLGAGGTVLRLSNLIGVGMGKSTVVFDIVTQIPGVGPVEVRDDSPIRDFLSVHDAADAFALALQSKAAGVMNVGSGIGTQIRDLAKLALAVAGETERPVTSLKQATRSSVMILDISEARARLGWTPSVALREELRQILEHRRAVA